MKPDPAAVHHICSNWNVPEETVFVVGDSLHDIDCGKEAGAGMNIIVIFSTFHNQ